MEAKSNQRRWMTPRDLHMASLRVRGQAAPKLALEITLAELRRHLKESQHV